MVNIVVGVEDSGMTLNMQTVLNYFIGQAYNASSESSLNNRCQDGWQDYGKGFPNEKRIFCEWVSQVGNAFGQVE